MNIKVDEITIQSDGYVYIEVLVPKKRPAVTRFDGTKGKPYTINERYRIITKVNKKIYVQYHCIKDGWNSYPKADYKTVENWWKKNKKRVINNTIKTIQGV